MESGMESKYKQVVFHESGWYCCCSSSWNISYSLYDTDDNQVKTLYSVDECKMFAFAYGLHLTNNVYSDVVQFESEAHKEYDLVMEVLRLATEGLSWGDVDIFLDKALDNVFIKCIIIPDEGIDYDMDYSCYD